MADFVAVLRRTLDGLKDPSAEMREKVYDKARATIAAKLAAINPPPPKSVIDRQTQALEAAIAEIEASYAVAEVDLDAEALDALLADDIFRETKAGSRPAPPRADPVKPAAKPAPGAVAKPASRQDPLYEDLDDSEVDWEGDEEEFDDEPSGRRARRRINWSAIALTLLVLLLAGGAGYGIWQYRQPLQELVTDLIGDSAAPEAATEQAVTLEPAGGQEEDAAEVTSAPATPGVQKFTQRLLEDGTEVDPGPAQEEVLPGEGTSIAARQPAQAPERPAATGETPGGSQRAIFYEERTSSAQGSAEPGQVTWSLVEESPGGGLPPEPAIRGEATIPGKDIQFRMTIRRNGDESLPASHIIEMIFLVPEGFEGGAIDNVLRVAFKESEQSPGNPLLGIPAKISDGFFLLALSDTAAEIQANNMMMRRLDWLDIPIVYRSGRRALITLEKGESGNRVFEEALRAWTPDAAGATP